MRHVRSLGDTPGIALCGYATAEDVRESQEAGFAIHLAKPVTLATLEAAIGDVTDGDPAERHGADPTVTLCTASGCLDSTLRVNPA